MTAENTRKVKPLHTEERSDAEFLSFEDRSRILTNYDVLLTEVSNLQDLDRVVSGDLESRTLDLPEGITSQDLNRKVRRPIPPVIWQIRSDISEQRFIPLQKWEGYVTRVEGDTFGARLIDRIEDRPEEELDEFPLEDVTPDDRELVKPGAVFYWQIGYRVRRGGQRERVSVIWFRRLPAWSREELEAAKDEARRVRNFIGWE